VAIGPCTEDGEVEACFNVVKAFQAWVGVRFGQQDQAAPSRSAGIIAGASVGRARHVAVPSSGASEGGRRSAVSLAGAGHEDSYRLAALIQELRNLTKSSRVSLSAASSARAAHSAAFCQQYPICSCMPPLPVGARCAAGRQRSPTTLNRKKAVSSVGAIKFRGGWRFDGPARSLLEARAGCSPRAFR
jgi:hypothetical protein